MKRILIELVHRVAPSRYEGYAEEVLSSGTIDGDYVLLEDEEYDRIAAKSSGEPQSGPGTELKLLLAGFPFYIKTSPGCACNKRAKYMDKMGAEWCANNMGQIVSWLKEEHTRQKLKVPFSSLVAHRLVKLAIQRAIVK